MLMIFLLNLSIVNQRKSGWATKQYAIESSFVSAEDVEAGCHVMQRCTLSFKMATKSLDLFLFGEDLDIFLDFMDDDEEIQGIFDEKVDEVHSDEISVQLEIHQL